MTVPTDIDVQTSSPDLAHRVIRHALRTARLTKGMDRSQVASRTSWPISRVMEIELGMSPISRDEIEELCEIYGISGRVRGQLLELADKAQELLGTLG